MKELETLQKGAIRLICNKDYTEHTEPLFHQTKTLKLQHLVELNYLKISNNIINKKESLPIINLFSFIKVSNTRTRSNMLNLMTKPKCRTLFQQRFPQYRLPNIYNNALKSYPIKVENKMATLTTGYKNWRFQQYSQFKCPNPKDCYSCNKK